MNRKANSSQAAWALVMEGVAAARVETHKLKKMLALASNMVDRSPAKEHLYRVAGDLIVGMPDTVEDLINDLDRTSYALSKIGTEHLKDVLPLSDRARVENGTTNPSRRTKTSASRVAEKFLSREDEG